MTNNKYTHKLILFFTVISIVGFGSFALAHMGQGPGYNRGGHHGYGGHHQGYGGFGENLSEAEIKQMQAERKAFFEATREIRAQIYQKRLEMGSELAKKDPDPERAVGLQKEISELKAQMGLKRLDHILKLKKINPDVNRGLMGHGGFGMMGPGMMGPGMMDPGMMGSGYHMGPGMGAGGSGSDNTRQYHGMQSSPTE
jgi:Spy/CpxP family protein refolding chaperone